MAREWRPEWRGGGCGGAHRRLKVGRCVTGWRAADLGDELDGALASEEVVVGHAADGDHGEAAVLDLLHLRREAVRKINKNRR